MSVNHPASSPRLNEHTFSAVQRAVPDIRAIDIFSGIGTLSREQLCGMIAMTESVDGLSLAVGAVDAVRDRIGLGREETATSLQVTRTHLLNSSIPDASLRFRLLVRISEGLDIPSSPPLSIKHAIKSASALAVRTSERLSPGVRQRRHAEEEPVRGADLKSRIGGAASYIRNSFARMASHSIPMPFPEIVAEELMAFFADTEMVEAAVRNADPEIAKALRKGHESAMAAIATGGGWATFALVVANAGFAPYILAAQASAFIPLVGGPTLVSLLATLVNPLTVMVGVSTIAWLSMGKGAQIVRSQIAARLTVLLSASGSGNRDAGLETFLSDMRILGGLDDGDVFWLQEKDLLALRERTAKLDGWMRSPMPRAAIAPPGRWNVRPTGPDVSDGLFVFGLSAGEMIWHSLAMDPKVLQAADFSRKADLADPLDFAANVHEFTSAGAGIALRGYTAERLVYDRLVADGHAVSFPEASNQQGFDLLVDGAEIQVKCGKSISILSEHFEKNPDIPVIANAALVEAARAHGEPWAPMVTTLPGFDLPTVEDMLSETLGHAADLADPDILEFALSIGLLRGGLEVARGRIPMGDLPAWMMIDGASRGLLGAVGTKVGAWVGLVSIGAAGAIVLAPVFGSAAIMANGTVKNAVQSGLMRDWIARMSAAADDLHGDLTEACDRRIACLQARNIELEANLGGSDLERWMAIRASDDLIAAVEDRLLLETRAPKTEAGCAELLILAADVAPADALALASSHLLQTVLFEKPGLNEVLMGNGGRSVKRFATDLAKAMIRNVNNH
ncbi:hypothetical protein [Roseibium suaedae]|nr:hypothetical protein [Roseibium suaedae]